MVPLRHGDRSKHILEFTQRHRLDKEQAVPESESELNLHRHGHPRAAVLGSRDLRQLHVLQQH